MLKTGVKDGPSKGKSFYICVDKNGCDFSQPARYLSCSLLKGLLKKVQIQFYFHLV